MNRLEIAVSLLGGGNFVLGEETIREAFKAADRIIAIHEETTVREPLKEPPPIIVDAIPVGEIKPVDYIMSNALAPNELELFWENNTVYSRVALTDAHSAKILDESFIWSESKQGFLFWLEISERLKKGESK